VIAPSHFVERTYVENGVRPDRIRVITRGFDVAGVPSPGPRPDGPLRVGYLGQVAPHKGVHLLVDAVRTLDVALAIHGPLNVDAAYVQQLRVHAGGTGRVTFHGSYAHADLPTILADLDVVVVPSLWHENSPTVISVAFTAGVPVLASNLGGLPELVRDGVDGLLFDPRPDALRDVLRRMIDDPSILERLRRGVRPPRRLDEELDDLGALYRTLIAARRQPAAR
jgi:glycosyltransferase involved in cell wall biosynthesis